MTWTTYHRRGEILRNAVAAADERLDGRLPTDLDGVTERFEDDLDLLSALTLKWHTRLTAHIEREIDATPHDLPGAVVRAWRTAAASMPGVRRIMDISPLVPVSSQRREWARLAISAGLAHTATPAAVEVGRSLEAQARDLDSSATPHPAATPSGTPNPEQTRSSHPGLLVERIRAVLAA